MKLPRPRDTDDPLRPEDNASREFLLGEEGDRIRHRVVPGKIACRHWLPAAMAHRTCRAGTHYAPIHEDQSGATQRKNTRPQAAVPGAPWFGGFTGLCRAV